MAGRTDESLRLVDFTVGGRPFGVLDLEDGAFFSKVRNTLQVRPGQRTVSYARQPGRYGGQRAVGAREENAEVAWTCAVQGATVDEALGKASDLLSKLADMSAGRAVEFRARDATYPTFLEVRGPGVATPAYDADLLEQEQAFLIELAVPVEPVGRMHRMDILDTFDVPGDAVLVRNNTVPNPRFALDTALWSTSVPAFHINPGGVITRSGAGGPTGIGIPSLDPPYAQFVMDNATQNFEGGSIPVAPPDGVAFRAGEPYTFSVYLHSLGGAGGAVQLFVGDASANSTSSTITVANNWSRYTLTWTPTSAVATAYLTVRNSAGVGVARTIGVVAAQVDVGNAALPYFDGEFDKARWTGPAHNSASELYDRSTLSDYTFDAGGGSGTIGAASGQLVPTSTAQKIMLHTARGHQPEDLEGVVEYVTGAVPSQDRAGFILAYLGAGEYLYGETSGNGSALRIRRVSAVLGSAILVSTTVTPAANTRYWHVFRKEGNVLTAEHWTTPPTPSGTPAASVTFTLATTDAARFGRGVSGGFGPYMLPGDLNMRIESMAVRPFTYKGRTLPELIPLGGAIPSDAPALVDVDVTHSGGAAAPAWALLGWAERPSIFNHVWNGDFEDDTNGWGTAADELTVGCTSVTRSTAAFRYGTASMQIVTPATINAGSPFVIFRRFRKGVTYTARAWVYAPASTTNVQLGFGRTGDEGTGNTLALSATAWQLLTTTWTPTADYNSAVVVPRIKAATATTFHVDGVDVFEGTTAPSLSSQSEGRGALPPFGIIAAESCDTGDLSGWAIASDANYRQGFGLKVTASGAGTAAAQWFIDPALLVADDFTLQEIDVEVFAKVDLASTLVSPKLVLSARPEAGTNYGAERFSTPFGSAGKLLTKPSSGSAFRTVRLGIVTMLVDPNRPQRWKFRLAASWAVGSTGNFGADELYSSIAAKRAAGITGKANDANYPKFVASTAETTKTVRSDLSGLTAKPPASPFPDSGLGGEPIELPPGNVDVLVKLASTVPDDPTSDTTSEQKEHTGTVHFAVTPRVNLLRGA